MTYSTVARRLTLRRTGVAIAVLTASLAVASTASAAACPTGSTGSTPVCVVTPDGAGGTGDHLGNAMQTAATVGGNETLILQPGIYLPQQLESTFGLPPVGSGENLTIVVPHNTQIPTGSSANATTIDGTNADPNHNADLFTVQNGGTLTIEGAAVVGTNLGDSAKAAVHVLSGGTLTLYGDILAGEQGLAELNIDAGGVANVNESTFNSTNTGVNAISSAGTLTLKSDTITNNGGLGLNNQGTTTADNTVFANNGDGATIFSCSSPIANQDQVYDDDNSCTGAGTDGAGNGSTINGGVYPIGVADNGGPTRTAVITVVTAGGTPVTTGDPAQCPTTDQRFFVIPQGMGGPQCGIGAESSNAQRGVVSNPGTGQVVDLPRCTVESGSPDYSTTPATETVLAGDTGSGLGLEPGSTADSTTGSVLIGTGANNPANTAAANPGAAVSNASTTDGSVVLLNPFSVPTFATAINNTNTTTQLQVKATKDGSHSTKNDTMWAFDVTNWAGIVNYCH